MSGLPSQQKGPYQTRPRVPTRATSGGEREVRVQRCSRASSDTCRAATAHVGLHEGRDLVVGEVVWGASIAIAAMNDQESGRDVSAQVARALLLVGIVVGAKDPAKARDDVLAGPAERACEEITYNAETAEPAEKMLSVFPRVLRALRSTSYFFTNSKI